MNLQATIPDQKPFQMNGITFGKKGLRDQFGVYYPVTYSKFIKASDGIECITIYAKRHLKGLPASLNVENNSDMQTDYFEKDRARFNSGSLLFILLKRFTS